MFTVAGCDDIIRQHKSACLRITALLTCKDILWIGTSAGVIVTMRLPHLTSIPTKISQLPPLIGEGKMPQNWKMGACVKIDFFPGNPHGHSGHVRFLTCVEMTPEIGGRKPFTKNGRFANRPGKTGPETGGVPANPATGNKIQKSIKRENYKN